jgi:hypothetical protein
VKPGSEVTGSGADAPPGVVLVVVVDEGGVGEV